MLWTGVEEERNDATSWSLSSSVADARSRPKSSPQTSARRKPWAAEIDAGRFSTGRAAACGS